MWQTWINPEAGFSPAQEKEYRQYFLRSDITQASIGIVFATLLVLVPVVLDLSRYGLDASVMQVTFYRLAMLAVSAALIVYLFLMVRAKDHRRYDALVLVWGLATIIFSQIPRLSQLSPPGTEIVLVLIFYLVVPSPFRIRLALGLLMTAAYLVITYYFTPQPVRGIAFEWGLIPAAALDREPGQPGVMGPTPVGGPQPDDLMALPLLMANIAGILLSARVYSLRRGQYRQLSEEKMLRSKLDLVASTDELTGIINRRKFVEQAQNELGRCLRYKRPFTMLMLDLDHFKQVNDRYGHIAGDMVLQQFAEAVQLQIRGVDIFGRLGGEEFGIVLIETPLEQAREAADRIRQAFMNTQINIAHDIQIKATVSIGLSQSLTGSDALYVVVDKADKALYQAKQNGRNRVEVA